MAGLVSWGWAVCWCLLFSLLAGGCGEGDTEPVCRDPLGCVEIAPGGPVVVGVMQVLSGDLRTIGLDQVRGVELAVAACSGEVLGHPVELVFEDSQCTKGGGSTAALKLAADPRIAGVVGPTCSGAAVGAAEIFSDSGMVLVSGSSTAPSLTSVGGLAGLDRHDFFLRTAQNGAELGRAAAVFAWEELGVARAAVINDGDEYTRGLTGEFKRSFQEFGGLIVLDAAVNKGDVDMLPVLRAVFESNAEFLFCPVFRPEGDYLVLQGAASHDLDKVAVMSSDGLFLDEFLQSAGESAQGMYFVLPDLPAGEAYEEFVRSYRERYGEPPSTSYHANTGDAASILFAAIEAVALQGKDGSLLIGRRALRDALFATRDFPGVTGAVTCDEFGDCARARSKVVRLDDWTAGKEALAGNVVFEYAPLGE